MKIDENISPKYYLQILVTTLLILLLFKMFRRLFSNTEKILLGIQPTFAAISFKNVNRFA
jgi:hypothetical protein